MKKIWKAYKLLAEQGIDFTQSVINSADSRNEIREQEEAKKEKNSRDNSSLRRAIADSKSSDEKKPAKRSKQDVVIRNPEGEDYMFTPPNSRIPVKNHHGIPIMLPIYLVEQPSPGVYRLPIPESSWTEHELWMRQYVSEGNVMVN